MDGLVFRFLIVEDSEQNRLDFRENFVAGHRRRLLNRGGIFVDSRFAAEVPISQATKAENQAGARWQRIKCGGELGFRLGLGWGGWRGWGGHQIWGIRVNLSRWICMSLQWT